MAETTGRTTVARGWGESGGSAGSAVRLEHITHRFGDFVALDDISFEVLKGEFLTLLGPSGSGKSTLLRIIAGLTQPTQGRVYIEDRDVSDTPAQRRGVGFVFQNYALFPHLSVFENIAYPLRIRRTNTSTIRNRVEAVLAKVNLEGLGSRNPAQLSGGQQQRVAVGRALVYEPAVLLMDEPLGALDRKLRKHMQLEVRLLQQTLHISCIYVTHDQEEALTMSDRIAVMQAGRVYQIGDPLTVYRHPSSSFVADFVGATNLLRCTVREVEPDHLLVVTDGGTEIAAPTHPGLAECSRCQIAIRPEFVKLSKTPLPGIRFPARIAKITFAGNVIGIDCTLETGELVRAEVVGKQQDRLTVGEAVVIGWDLADVAIFPTGGTC